MKKISILIFLLLMISGCGTLPATVEIGPDKTRDVIESFKAMISERHQCGLSIDAAARIEFKSLFQNGVVNGYLQAMSPSCLKFVGINPFGQPLVVLVTNGNLFHYLVVPEAKGYQGNIQGETFSKYAPDGFQPGFTFYWLTGRLAPGVFKIMEVSRDEEGQGYWLKLLADKNNSKSLILFDDQAGVICRHLIIDDQNEIIMNIFYDDYTKAPCPLPGKITVKSLIHNSSMQIRLTDWLQDVDLGPENFSCRLPAGFKRVIVP